MTIQSNAETGSRFTSPSKKTQFPRKVVYEYILE